jgi:hypothetical protein
MYHTLTPVWVTPLAHVHVQIAQFTQAWAARNGRCFQKTDIEVNNSYTDI